MAHWLHRLSQLPFLSCPDPLFLLNVFSIKYASNFFEAVAFGLREQEVCNEEKDHQEHTEDDVVLPANVVKPDRISEGGNDEGAVDCEELQCQALGSQRVWEDLGRIPEEKPSKKVSML